MDQPSISLSTVPSNSRNYFPSDVLKWMKANAKPLMAVKLMQVCKYFQHQQFPYVVLEDISTYDSSDTNTDRNWYYTQVGSNCNPLTGNLDIFTQNNLWIKGCLTLEQRNDVNNLLRKTVVCQLKCLNLESQCLTMNELEVLASSNMLKEVIFANTTITDTNNQTVPLETILNCLSNTPYITFHHTVPPILSLEDAKNLALPKLRTLDVSGMSEAFDVDTFLIFIKAHPTIGYGIEYPCYIDLSPKYMNRLQQHVDMIIEENSTKYPVPTIAFPGQKNKENLHLLINRYWERKLYRSRKRKRRFS